MARTQAPIVVAIIALAAAGCEEVAARRGIQQGNKAYYDGQYDTAIVEYEAALAKKPQLAIGWYNLGLAHLALFAAGLKTPENEKHAQGAIKGFTEYLKIEPSDGKALDYLLSTYIDSGHYEGALSYFQDKLEKDPNDVNALAQLAQINEKAGKLDVANQWHRRRVDVETSTDAKADAWYSIGVNSWRRLYNHAEVAGTARAKIADEGIFALQQADGIRKSHQATLAYMNLVYRERAFASDASWARMIDLATAQVHTKQAIEIAKRGASAAVAPQKPATPPKK